MSDDKLWPFDISRYNRRHTLTGSEREGIACALKKRAQAPRGWIAQHREQLARLVVPLEDLLAFVGEVSSYRTHAVCWIVLREMHDRQLAFWAWPHQIWREILNTGSRRALDIPDYKAVRGTLLAVAYVLDGLDDIHTYKLLYRNLARRVFGQSHVDALVERVGAEFKRMGYAGNITGKRLPTLLPEVLLVARSPHLEGVSVKVLERMRMVGNQVHRADIRALSRALHNMGVIERALPWHPTPPPVPPASIGVPKAWYDMVTRWHSTSTLEKASRDNILRCLCKAGRWLGQAHPELADPAAWRHEHAIEIIAMIDKAKVGEWVVSTRGVKDKVGKPLSPAVRSGWMNAMRTFFRDCQDWGWIPRHFNPSRVLATPRSVRAKLGTNPRVISDEIWAKLLWAGLNLTDDDLPKTKGLNGPPITSIYPLELVRAVAITWLFSGLRRNEILRLRVGCIRWQRTDVVVPETEAVLRKDDVCWLDVPVTKTSRAFTKPVDPLVGHAINAWERIRPEQRAALDPKTNELVSYLFFYRERQLSLNYINRTLIPMLCRKAGLPLEDARGKISSHRARSTIATQLYNSREPMTLFELQEWLGHRSPSSTQHYAKVSPTKLAKKYEQAGYFKRNVRTIEVLIDRDAIVSGAAAEGTPWQYYDLGHGWCTNAYFVECRHRMACPKCQFYVAKGSAKGQFIEGQANLQRMLQEIPLTEDERAAVEEGIELFEKLCEGLADVPTPAGPTPRQLTRNGKRSLPILQPA